tara:strand:+ start:4041 stop:5078 length:1038 start_codon:yes stop_codon:yes gene_type:complete
MVDEAAASNRAVDEMDLISVSGPDTFERIRVSLSAPVTIGRSKECGIVLNESSVSREHASISKEDGKVLIRDNESRAGIAVNMMFLEKGDSQEIFDRDLLTIGPWKILVRLGSENSDATAAQVAGADDATSQPASEEPRKTSSKDKDKDKDSIYATRASIFIRLQADGSMDRELGWQEFTEKYARVIAGFARNAGLRAQDADDVLQDVLLGFFRVSEQFEYDPDKGRFRGYLKRVTLNAIRARHRRKRPSTFIKDDYDPPAEMPDVDAAWDRQWTEQLLQRAMTEVRGTVEDRTWKAFELYGVRGVPAEQVAERLDMTPAAIRHAKMRLVKQVREIVDQLRDEEG